MRILQLGKFYPIRGGVEKVEYDLMKGVVEHGVNCDMLCAGNEGYCGEKEVQAKGKIVACRTWLKAAGTMIAPTMITILRACCHDYDIIHVHHPDPMACLALWLSGYKGKVVLHWHSDIIKQHTALKLYKPLQNWLIKRADKIICTSPIYMKESPYLSDVQNKIECVPIGINPILHADDVAVRELKARYGNRKMVFSLGRLVHYKGFEYLIHAAKLMPDDYIVLIGGVGPLKRNLTGLIRNLHLQDKVKLLGRIDDVDLPLYYQACDVFCMSSVQKTEAFGIVQIEAMSCGKPLVATKIPGSGVSWVNQHGVSGLNAEPCDSESLADAITSIVENRELYELYSAGSKKRFKETFTKEKMISHCLKIYHDLLS